MASFRVEGLDDAAFAKNVRFGIARALTMTAKAASETVTSKLPTIFDKPTPFTQKGIGFKPAKKDSLVATVFVKDAQAGYLQIQESGGVRTPRPGSPINIAIRQRRNQYGNIPKGALGRALQKDDTFVATGRDARTKKLAPGIYQRGPYGKGKRRAGGSGTKGQVFDASGKAVGGRAAKGGGTLKMLVAFRKKANYQPRFKFEERVNRAALAVLRGNLASSIRDALETARRGNVEMSFHAHEQPEG